MTRMRTKKTERDEFLSKNQGHAIKYRKRLQEDAETEQELKEFIKEDDASKPIQDPIRRKHLSE